MVKSADQGKRFKEAFDQAVGIPKALKEMVFDFLAVEDAHEISMDALMVLGITYFQALDRRIILKDPQTWTQDILENPENYLLMILTSVILVQMLKHTKGSSSQRVPIWTIMGIMGFSLLDDVDEMAKAAGNYVVEKVPILGALHGKTIGNAAEGAPQKIRDWWNGLWD